MANRPNRPPARRPATPRNRAPAAPAQPAAAPAAAPATPAAPRPPKAPYTPEQRFRLWVIAAVAAIGLGIVVYNPPAFIAPRGPVAGGPGGGGAVTPPPPGPVAGGGTPPAPQQVQCPVQTVTFDDGPARVVSGLPVTAPTLQGCERVTNMQLSGRCPGHEVHFVSPSGDPRWKYRVNCPTLVKTTT